MATSLLYLGLYLGLYSILVIASSGSICVYSCCSYCSCYGVARAVIGVASGAVIGITCSTAVGIASGIGGAASGIGRAAGGIGRVFCGASCGA
jgi:hypothetical protein